MRQSAEVFERDFEAHDREEKEKLMMVPSIGREQHMAQMLTGFFFRGMMGAVSTNHKHEMGSEVRESSVPPRRAGSPRGGGKGRAPKAGHGAAVPGLVAG